MIGARWNRARGFRVTGPFRITLSVFGIALLSVGLLYLFVDCGPDWVVLAGILIDIGGALGLAILDIPRLASLCYAGRLEKLREAYSTTSVPSPDRRRAELLLDVLFPETGPPEHPEFDVERVENGRNWLLIDSPDEPTDRIPFDVLQRRLRVRTEAEADRVRRLGAYLLIGGFGLQFLGQLFGSFVLVRLLAAGLGLFGVAPPGC